jgi:hypothetical protein
VIGCGDLAGHALCRADGRVDDRRIAPHRLERDGQGDVRDLSHVARARDDERASADAHAIGRDHGESVLGGQCQWRQARERQRLVRRHDLTPVLGPASTQRHLGDRGHVHQVGRADRADLRDDRVDACVQQPDKRANDRRRCPGPAASDPVEADGHRGPNDLARQRRPEPSDVARHDRLLVGDQGLGWKALITQMPEAGVQPVDRLGPGKRGVDHRPARDDPVHRAVRQVDSGALGDADELREGERALADRDRRIWAGVHVLLVHRLHGPGGRPPMGEHCPPGRPGVKGAGPSVRWP